ncbi:hypothetical protein [Flavobacterium sp.]|nr:hypothetical protein [Flavobacterium sp.]
MKFAFLVFETKNPTEFIPIHLTTQLAYYLRQLIITGVYDC